MVGRLDALLDGEAVARLAEGLLDGGDEGVDVLVALGDVALDALGDAAVVLGFLVAEPDVLHLGLDAVQAEPVRQRDEDEHGLGEDLVPLVLGHVFDGAAVVQPVRELDQHDADVVVEGQQDALEVLRLEALRAGRLTLAVLVVQHGLDLGEAVHQGRDLVPEEVADVLDRVGGVFDDVVQQGGADGLAAQADLRDDNLGDGDGVEHVRLARAAADVLMGLVGELEGLPDDLHLLFVLAALGGDLHQRGVLLVDQAEIIGCELGKTHYLASVSHAETLYLSTFWKL